jgi:hypothetical protein
MRWPEIKARELFADLIVIFGVIAVVGILWLTFFAENPVSFVIRMQQVISQKKRFLLHKIDHHALTEALRDLHKNKTGERQILIKMIRDYLNTCAVCTRVPCTYARTIL